MSTQELNYATVVPGSDQAKFYTICIIVHAFIGILVDLHLPNSYCLHSHVIHKGELSNVLEIVQTKV